jgi:3-hydroxyisobutyrate dehydrogenase-like beta-hydroxyacid dehydrogenase
MSNVLSPPALAAQSTSFPFSRPATPGVHGRQVGFVGLGNIGFAMAKNLAQNGPEHVKGLPPVKVWNRTQSKSEKLLELVGADKASIAASPEEIALQCDIIVVNLSNDDVVRKIYTRFNEALKVSIFLSSSI